MDTHNYKFTCPHCHKETQLRFSYLQRYDETIGKLKFVYDSIFKSINPEFTTVKVDREDDYCDSFYTCAYCGEYFDTNKDLIRLVENGHLILETPLPTIPDDVQKTI